ncbi:MAG: helix-turn-helix domain-containing protein [Candidatus Acidiferrales bacterium]
MAATRNLDFIHDASRAAVLLDPLRLRMVEQLCAEPDSASGLARRLKLPRQKLNYHLRELEKEGFVKLVEERRKGNCIERVVRATARAYVIDPSIMGALGIDPAQFQDRFSSSYLVAVAAKTIRDVAALRQRAEKAGKRLATFTLQTEVRFASAAERAAFVEELTAQVARLAAKYHDEQAAGGRKFQFVLGAYPAVKSAQPESAGAEESQTATSKEPS